MKRLLGSLLAGAALFSACAATAAPPPGYGKWKHGPPSDPSYFPIAVWLQSPSNAPAYKAAGFNLYVGLWEGPTAEQLAALTAAKMPVITEQRLKFKDDPIIVGWMHQDEPDNAQEVTDPATGKKDYGPCVPPEKMVAEYEQMRAADPTRPVMINLGQGVSNEKWIGRGNGSKLDDYKTYVKGADIISFDVYPVTSALEPVGGSTLFYVPRGVDRLIQWSGGGKPVWNCIECTAIAGTNKPTPAQVRAEVWLSLVHGSRGLIYFVHQFAPTFDEHALLDDPAMLREVTAVNQQVHTLAPVLNSGEASSVRATAPPPQVGLDLMVKRQGGATYLFAVNGHDTPVDASIALAGLPARATAEVVGEKRMVSLAGAKLTETFPPYAVRIYRIR